MLSHMERSGTQLLSISVVIPTRNRSETLRSTLKTCIRQDSVDYEILVFDNSDPGAERDKVRAVIADIGDKRIRIEQSAKVLAMSESWETAVSLSRGRNLMIIGDDDGLIPNGVDLLMHLINKYPGQVLHWRTPFFIWAGREGSKNHASFRFFAPGEHTLRLASKEVLHNVCHFHESYFLLPSIYTSLIPRQTLDNIRSRTGRLFHTTSPDIGIGLVISMFCTHFYSIPVPITICGVSKHSNGARDRKPDISREFNSLNVQASLAPKSELPNKYFSVSIEVAGNILKLNELFGELGMPLLKYSPEKMVKAAIREFEPEAAGETEDFIVSLGQWAQKHSPRSRDTVVKEGSLASSTINQKCQQNFPSQKTGWSASAQSFFGLFDNEMISNIEDFSNLLNSFYRYGEISNCASLPYYFDLRAGMVLHIKNALKKQLGKIISICKMDFNNEGGVR